MKFKDSVSFEDRLKESKRIGAKYPDRVGCIVEKYSDINLVNSMLSGKFESLPDIDKKKYLVPNDLTVGQFIYVIRKRLKLKPAKALFIFVNNTMPSTTLLMSELFHTHKDKDGFLYFTYSFENTFG